LHPVDELERGDFPALHAIQRECKVLCHVEAQRFRNLQVATGIHQPALVGRIVR